VNGGVRDCDGESGSINDRTRCLMRGAPGSYTRASVEAKWRRTVTDSLGQQFTPFMSVRGDAAWRALTTGTGVSNFVSTDNSAVFRAMPAVGLEYRWPFASVQKWGTQILEPIAQFIFRPDEREIGRLPNEDAQALVFDDGNLFRIDKFSGWDRAEGGGRVNYGLQYNAQFNSGARLNALIGQSYHLFGVNSYAVRDMANTGLDSGLETRRSDYVARVMYAPNANVSLISRFRFDERTFDPRRVEFEARTRFDKWSISALYGNYDPQPELGYLTQREVVSALTSYRFAQNWTFHVGARYDIHRDEFDQTLVGLSYLDECFSFGATYTTDNSFSNNAQRVHRVMLSVSYRTLGDGGVARTVGSTEDNGGR
jgi:LPS-assembly protein